MQIINLFQLLHITITWKWILFLIIVIFSGPEQRSNSKSTLALQLSKETSDLPLQQIDLNYIPVNLRSIDWTSPGKGKWLGSDTKRCITYQLLSQTTETLNLSAGGKTVLEVIIPWQGLTFTLIRINLPAAINNILEKFNSKTVGKNKVLQTFKVFSL